MRTSKLGVVAAVSRPERVEKIVALFAVQTFQDAELVLCLNGKARDANPSAGTKLACEGGTPARPRNAGLAYLRERGAGIVAFWDDDDYYGPGYLAELAGALEGKPRRVVGKHVRFVRYPDGLYYCLAAQENFLGGTMGGWVESLPPIPDLPAHEDHEWCELMRREGFELSSLGARHYVYNRLPGLHAWKSTKTQALHTYGPALYFGEAADSIVDGPLSNHSAEFVASPTLDDVTAELLANVMSRPIGPP